MTTTALEIHGHCDERFAAVRAEFERNFAERGDVGAARGVGNFLEYLLKAGAIRSELQHVPSMALIAVER